MLYKKIDSSSVNTISSALNFFETPPTNVSIANSAYRCYLTLNPISSFPFNFKIHPITSFIDLSKCYLQTEFKLRKKDADGTVVNLIATDDVSTIQMIGATWIKNLKIVVNGQVYFILLKYALKKNFRRHLIVIVYMHTKHFWIMSFPIPLP
jgi:hypothetical protein